MHVSESGSTNEVLNYRQGKSSAWYTLTRQRYVLSLPGIHCFARPPRYCSPSSVITISLLTVSFPALLPTSFATHISQLERCKCVLLFLIHVRLLQMSYVHWFLSPSFLKISPPSCVPSLVCHSKIINPFPYLDSNSKSMHCAVCESQRPLHAPVMLRPSTHL